MKKAQRGETARSYHGLSYQRAAIFAKRLGKPAGATFALQLANLFLRPQSL